MIFKFLQLMRNSEGIWLYAIRPLILLDRQHDQ